MDHFLNIDRVAFIGRTYAEYMRMFALEEPSLRNRYVLDCPAGPSSFAAEAHKLDLPVAACDVLYGLTLERLIEKGEKDIQHVFKKFDEVADLYEWKHYKNKDEVIGLRRKALAAFAADYEAGTEDGRYTHAELPRLPFPDSTFSLVLSSHFLFLYGDRLSLQFHKACLKELIRVASEEVRIFPLTGLDARPYPHLDEVISFLRSEDIETEMVKIPFEFQKGANRMLRIRRKERRHHD
jgi:hypothetical protein